MVLFVRLLSRRDRDVAWWERYEALVWAHCSVPWETVLGYDREPAESDVVSSSAKPGDGRDAR
jgi:hypothetical protein